MLLLRPSLLLLVLVLAAAAVPAASAAVGGSGRRRSTVGWVASPLHGRQGQGLRSGRRASSLAMAAAGAGGKPR